MKRIFLTIILLGIVYSCIAQNIVNIPYDATSIPDEYRDSNPDYVMYPATLEGKDSIEMSCILFSTNCIEAVDLGLSVKWATCNIGASSPSDFGKYFAWGELCPKSKYTWETYKLSRGAANLITKYFVGVDDKTELESCDDIATYAWGDEWRMPTKEECIELLNRCSWSFQNNGYKVVGPNGNSIFLPTTGVYYNTHTVSQSDQCSYWTKTLDNSAPQSAHILSCKPGLNHEKSIG